MRPGGAEDVCVHVKLPRSPAGSDVSLPAALTLTVGEGDCVTTGSIQRMRWLRYYYPLFTDEEMRPQDVK